MRFRSQIRLIAVLAVLWLASLSAASAQAGATRAPLVQSVSAISTTVADLERSVRFYSQVLSFEQTSDRQLQVNGAPVRVVRMKLGDEAIELEQFEGTRGKPVPLDSRSNDRWFQHIAIVVSDMDRAYAALKANRVEPASVAPQRLPDWNKNAAGIRAFYFKDPDGHPLELLQFPGGKGDPKWQRSGGRLFLGIDHTAIVVADTEASLKFYRDRLGFRVAGASENYGREQERLNNVPGAHLRITSLRAQSGPGIELLEYLAPRAGRQLPKPPAAADLVHRQTILIAGDLTTLEGSTLLIHDPDGHELLIRGTSANNTYGELK